MIKLLAASLATLLAMTSVPSVADEAKEGVVVCYAKSFETGLKVVGSRQAHIAYEDAVDQSNPEFAHLEFTNIPNAPSEFSYGVKAGVFGGYILFDRGVEMGSDYEVGISARYRLESIGDYIAGCKLVAEMPVCALSTNEKVSVSCDNPKAIK